MVKTGYELLAEEYYDPFHRTCRNFDAATKAVLTQNPPKLPDTGLILDVGCGRGRCHEFLGVPDTRIVQLDSSRTMLKLDPRESCLLRVHADATEIPLDDEQFAAVVGFLIDPFIGLCFFTEAHRLLKSGGLFLSTTPAHEWGTALRGADEPKSSHAQFITKAKRPIQVPSTLIPPQNIVDMLKHCGFDQIKVVPQTLPRDATPISDDIQQAANRIQTDIFQLPIVYLIEARKP